MSKEAIEQFEKELRRDYPKMFSHQELREGEVWVGDEIVENIFYLDRLKEVGYPSARSGHWIGSDSEGHPLCAPKQPFFVSFEDLAKVHFAQEEKKKASLVST